MVYKDNWRVELSIHNFLYYFLLKMIRFSLRISRHLQCIKIKRICDTIIFLWSLHFSIICAGEDFNTIYVSNISWFFLVEMTSWLFREFNFVISHLLFLRAEFNIFLFFQKIIFYFLTICAHNWYLMCSKKDVISNFYMCSDILINVGSLKKKN